MEPALAYIEDVRRRTGQRVTVTHMVIKAIGAALAACGDANVVLRGSRPYRRRGRRRVGAGGGDGRRRAGGSVGDEDRSGRRQDPGRDRRRAGPPRAGTFAPTATTGCAARGAPLGFVPTWLMGLVLRFMTFLSYTLNLDLRRFGVPRDPFGAAVVSSIGSLGLESALIPRSPTAPRRIVIAAGAVTDEPVVEGDKVVPGKVMRIGATFDHRIIDGGPRGRDGRGDPAHDRRALDAGARPRRSEQVAELGQLIEPRVAATP